MVEYDEAGGGKSSGEARLVVHLVIASRQIFLTATSDNTVNHNLINNVLDMLKNSSINLNHEPPTAWTLLQVALEPATAALPPKVIPIPPLL